MAKDRSNLITDIRAGHIIQIGPDVTITMIGRVLRPNGRRSDFRIAIQAPRDMKIDKIKTERGNFNAKLDEDLEDIGNF